MQTSQTNHRRRPWSRGATGPIIMIGIGALFLAHNFGLGFDIGRWWPVVLILVGGGLLMDRLNSQNS
jgi:cell wall-active antibiotic response 4TMS protein YvqF